MSLHELNSAFIYSYRVIIREPKPTAHAPSWPHQAPTRKVPRGRWPPSNRANHSKASNQPANHTTRPAAVGGSRETSATLALLGGKDQIAVFQRRTRTGEKKPQGEVRTVTIQHCCKVQLKRFYMYTFKVARQFVWFLQLIFIHDGMIEMHTFLSWQPATVVWWIAQKIC